ncbi:hypothetical protein BDV34DRAFT_220924 [Aspergillus parasiticus]|uniref:Uncharacterized protein n=1 Tax=Aspergillus parasiticus TaxID=5067 RepID=A0A5N6DYL9_ASPPA|nr:hypothetical protein BDV34DRAFT_220924 [Aspergillus parasiticus]
MTCPTAVKIKLAGIAGGNACLPSAFVSISNGIPASHSISEIIPMSYSRRGGDVGVSLKDGMLEHDCLWEDGLGMMVLGTWMQESLIFHAPALSNASSAFPGSRSHDFPANPASIGTPTRMSLNPQGKDFRSLLGDPDARQQPRPRPRGSQGPPSEETRKVRMFSFPPADNSSASKPRWFLVSATCTGQRAQSATGNPVANGMVRIHTENGPLLTRSGLFTSPVSPITGPVLLASSSLLRWTDARQPAPPCELGPAPRLINTKEANNLE